MSLIRPTTTSSMIRHYETWQSDGRTAQVTFLVHDALVTSVHPKCPFVVRLHHARTLFWVVPVPISTMYELRERQLTNCEVFHPFWMRYPATSSSPGVLTGTTAPVLSTILARTCGCILPTVSTRLTTGSEGVVWKETGLHTNEQLLASCLRGITVPGLRCNAKLSLCTKTW